MRSFTTVDLSRSRVLDGGMATELERHGVAIDGPLWSARALAEAPDAVLAVHRAYLDAGAAILLTASYQVSAIGYAASGLRAAAASRAAADALRRSVQLAVEARADRSEVLVAASLGPYGAALANGAEYHGDYGFRSEAEEHEALVQFHRERVSVLLETDADLLAFETIPSLAEARAIVEALETTGQAHTMRPAAWISFACRGAAHTAHGELLFECARSLDEVPQVLAVGVNCTAPALVSPLLRALRSGTGKPLLVYPNSGEGWDSARRCWTGEGDLAAYEALARDWYRQGAQMVGGCCRTGPEHVRVARRVAEGVFNLE